MEFLFADFINNYKVPKLVRYLAVYLICGFIAVLGVMVSVHSKMPVGIAFGALLVGAAVLSAVYLTVKIRKSLDYAVKRISDEPYLVATAAKWFHEKRNIGEEIYLESMKAAVSLNSAYPEWYLALDKNDRIIGGAGVIDNDFHDRVDLTPNVCAVFVEEDERGKGIAGEVLGFICRDMKKRGVDTLYLVTDLDGFYERYGWKYFCDVNSRGQENSSKLLVYRS